MIKELKMEKQLLNSINILIETFNYFLGEDKKIDINSHGVRLLIRDEPYGIDALSSGERHLFTFLALVVTDARDRDFLIIDEPEISLNATWQRSLVKLLEDLAPDTQIILASHSPIIAKGQPSSLVELNPSEIPHE
jgi:predicted ATPase